MHPIVKKANSWAPYKLSNVWKVELPAGRPPIQFRQVSPNSSPPSSPEPKRANLQKCINQTGLFPSLTVSAESDLCDKNQAAVAALPQLPFPEKCINFADFQKAAVLRLVSHIILSQHKDCCSIDHLTKLEALLKFFALNIWGCYYFLFWLGPHVASCLSSCILQEISVGGPSDIPHTELFHNSTDVSGGGILGINNVFAIASHFSDRKIPAQGRSLDF